MSRSEVPLAHALAAQAQAVIASAGPGRDGAPPAPLRRQTAVRAGGKLLRPAQILDGELAVEAVTGRRCARAARRAGWAVACSARAPPGRSRHRRPARCGFIASIASRMRLQRPASSLQRGAHPPGQASHSTRPRARPDRHMANQPSASGISFIAAWRATTQAQDCASASGAGCQRAPQLGGGQRRDPSRRPAAPAPSASALQTPDGLPTSTRQARETLRLLENLAERQAVLIEQAQRLTRQPCAPGLGRLAEP